MDRMLAIIIIFLGAMILTAAVLAMGAVPQIFKTAKELDITQEVVNQTQIRLEAEEDRSRHTNLLVNQVQTIITDHHEKLENYIKRSNNTTERILNDILAIQLQQQEAETQRDKIQKHIEELADDILNITKETHKDVDIEKDRKIVRDIYDLVKDINSTLR